MNFIDNLKWRYATKEYDTSKKVNESDLNLIKEAMSNHFRKCRTKKAPYHYDTGLSF
jgi:hypothetical protein